MKIVYIAHQVSGDIAGNIEKILAIVKKINLERTDIVPFAPYIPDLLALDDNNPIHRNRGISNDIAILESGMVNELWIYGPRITGGMQAEIDLAWVRDIPIILMDAKTDVPVDILRKINIGFE